MTQTIRVLLADDHPLVRWGIRSTLAQVEDIAVIGETTDGYEAQTLCRELEPDVILLDVSMPGPAAFETVAFLREHCPTIKIVVLTAYDDDAYITGLVGTGVEAYVLKDEVPETMVEAIRAAMAGRLWFSQSVLEKLTYLQTSEPPQTEAPALTERELAILRGIVAGKTDQEIGQELDMAERTVRYRLHSMYHKLRVDSRIEAAVQAVRLGLVDERKPGNQSPG